MKFKDYLENEDYENVFDGDDLFDKFDIIHQPMNDYELNNLYIAEEIGNTCTYKKGERLEITEKEQYDLWLLNIEKEAEEKYRLKQKAHEAGKLIGMFF